MTKKVFISIRTDGLFTNYECKCVYKRVLLHLFEMQWLGNVSLSAGGAAAGGGVGAEEGECLHQVSVLQHDIGVTEWASSGL